MNLNKENIYEIAKESTKPEEVFDCLLKNENIIIERIITPNTDNPNSQWYNQDWDEWVLILKGFAKIEFDNNIIKEFREGDYIYIEKNLKHRVIFTQSDTNTIWLAIHLK